MADDFERMQNWPEPGRVEAIRLTAQQWAFAVSALEYWADVSERSRDEPEAAVTNRRIATLVRERLTEQGLDPSPQR
jgi:hypothetical protein